MDNLIAFFSPFGFLTLLMVSIVIVAVISYIWGKVDDYLSMRRYRRYAGKLYSENWRVAVKKHRR